MLRIAYTYPGWHGPDTSSVPQFSSSTVRSTGLQATSSRIYRTLSASLAVAEMMETLSATQVRTGSSKFEGDGEVWAVSVVVGGGAAPGACTSLPRWRPAVGRWRWWRRA